MALLKACLWERKRAPQTAHRRACQMELLTARQLGRQMDLLMELWRVQQTPWQTVP